MGGEALDPAKTAPPPRSVGECQGGEAEMGGYPHRSRGMEDGIGELWNGNQGRG